MSIRLIAGDCRDVLPTLAADSVQCVVCSPPYYGLRDYGTALWDGGGDAACDHTMPTSFLTSTLGASTGGRSDETHERSIRPRPYRDTCGKCGAVRIDRQIGLEATPDAYLATMVAVFREVRRVLRRDGTCWVNLGDSYAGNNNGYSGDDRPSNATSLSSGNRGAVENGQRSRPGKPKDLLMMPARLALALQADGWWVRSAIVWAKPNPMPESCRDRPTSAYEMVYLLTKSARYYYDADAVREEAEYGYREQTGVMRSVAQDGRRHTTGTVSGSNPASGRNLRNVWTIATSPFSAAHFATFPPELAERCIRAGTSERGACSACGKPWGRIIERTFTPQTDVSLERGIKGADGQKPMDASNGWDGMPRGSTTATTTGWQPGCDHGADTVPCTVLDPFAGAGTTLLVADRLQRDAIGIELSPDYTTMAMERCRADAPLFTSFSPAEDPEDARMRDLFAEAAE